MKYSICTTGEISQAGSGSISSCEAERSEDRNFDRAVPDLARKTILVPVTLRGASYVALAVAQKLAHEIGAGLILLHSVQLNIAGEERGIQRTRLLQDLCLDAASQLRQLVDAVGGKVPADFIVSEGRPSETIVATAGRLRAETIVMFSHGLRGWRRWMHGNIAASVIRKAPCSVLLVLPGRKGGTLYQMPGNIGCIKQIIPRVACYEGKTTSGSLVRALLSWRAPEALPTY